MATSSSFPSSSSSSSSTLYDIFLSFRGTDTRKTITSHLFGALKNLGYIVFHDTLLKRGQDVSSELLKAIEESKLSIVVLSKHYADSRWCLDELVKIMDCRRSSHHIVLPVFYDVEPSDVRNQTGPYAAAFTNYKKIHEAGLVDKWKTALEEAGHLAGLHLRNDSNGDEANFVTVIVTQVAENLDQPYLNVADYTVGIESHVEKLQDLLSLGTNEICVVVIWGLGGIGKTTIAKAIFNKICGSFKGSCFLADVRATAMQPDGLVKLQEILISSVLKQNMPKIHNCHQGVEVIKQKLWRQKVLIVLDDIDSINQLESLAINRSCLPQGSRVIITTRDRSSVDSLDAKLYEPEPLNSSNSLKLFKWYAFGEHYPKEVYEVLSKKVVAYAGGLPLVLKTLGSFMRSLRTVQEWEEALERLRVIPSDDVQEKLKISFDSLHDREKELCLDIACFFIGMDQEFVFQVLDEKSPEYYPKFEFKVLCNRCLVKIDEDGKLLMHDMVRDMGREIVRQESLKEPGRRSRLWHPKDVLSVLKESSGTEAIESIILELAYSDEETVDVKVFTKMRNLRMIRVRHLNMRGTYKKKQYLDKLKFLSWYSFPLRCIPSNLDLRNLVALDLQKSRLRKLWKGTKVLSKLRFLNVSDSYFLTTTPDLSGLINLEKLWFCNCTKLVEIHHSVGRLHKLVFLDLTNCKSLTKVPVGIFQLNSLEDVNLSGCSKLQKAARSEVSFSNLWHLFSSALLRKSRPRNRESNFLLTSSVPGQSFVKVLRLENCNLAYVPMEFGSLVSLEELYLSGNKFSSLPASIRNLRRLRYLKVEDCCKLKSIVDLPNDLLLVAAEGSLSLETIQITSEPYTETHVRVSKGTKLIDNIFTGEEYCAFSTINVSLDGEEIPDWFDYQGQGAVSFVAPKCINRSIRGWIVGVSAWGSRSKIFSYVYVYVCNTTKDTMHTIFLGFSSSDLLLSYIPISKYGIVMDGGDEIRIVFRGTSYITQCGIRLVYDNRYEDLQVDDQSAIQYSPPIYLNYADDEACNMSLEESISCLVSLFKPIVPSIAAKVAAGLLGPVIHSNILYAGLDKNAFLGVVKELEGALQGLNKEALLRSVEKVRSVIYRATLHASEGTGKTDSYVVERELQAAIHGTMLQELINFVEEAVLGAIKEVWPANKRIMRHHHLKDLEEEDLIELVAAVSGECTNVMKGYVIYVLFARIKSILEDIVIFDEKALLGLVKDIAAGGGGSMPVRSEHRQFYLIIANAVYTTYAKSYMEWTE